MKVGSLFRGLVLGLGLAAGGCLGGFTNEPLEKGVIEVGELANVPYVSFGNGTCGSGSGCCSRPASPCRRC